MAKRYVDTRFDLGNGCSIGGCQRRHYALGLCQAHYARNRRHGDPLGGSTGWGEIRKWIEEVAIPYDGDDCLIYPFKRNDKGYGAIKVDGVAVGAHAYVLSRRGGSKPNNSMECCHSCGRGGLGCVTFKHMRWDTHEANMAEAALHGSARNSPRYGEDHHDFRATDEVVAKIMADLSSGMTQLAAAKKYGFAQSHISRLKNGWRRAQK